MGFFEAIGLVWKMCLAGVVLGIFCIWLFHWSLSKANKANGRVAQRWTNLALATALLGFIALFMFGMPLNCISNFSPLCYTIFK